MDHVSVGPTEYSVNRSQCNDGSFGSLTKSGHESKKK